jgi:hypothetical protein
MGVVLATLSVERGMVRIKFTSTEMRTIIAPTTVNATAMANEYVKPNDC